MDEDKKLKYLSAVNLQKRIDGLKAKWIKEPSPGFYRGRKKLAIAVPPTTQSDLRTSTIERINGASGKLPLDSSVFNYAIDHVNKVREKLGDRPSKTLAACAVYYAVKHYHIAYPLKSICRYFDVSQSTISTLFTRFLK